MVSSRTDLAILAAYVALGLTATFTFGGLPEDDTVCSVRGVAWLGWSLSISHNTRLSSPPRALGAHGHTEHATTVFCLTHSFVVAGRGGSQSSRMHIAHEPRCTSLLCLRSRACVCVRCACETRSFQRLSSRRRGRPCPVQKLITENFESFSWSPLAGYLALYPVLALTTNFPLICASPRLHAPPA
jgi:hypothetical protein